MNFYSGFSLLIRKLSTLLLHKHQIHQSKSPDIDIVCIQDTAWVVLSEWQTPLSHYENHCQ